ncbi:MAG TPA: hypothetical protein VLW50_34020 [Streptosporangiaceae bacterium]|nr:hypothetical protein [Streptosporangiaceae bacterium]
MRQEKARPASAGNASSPDSGITFSNSVLTLSHSVLGRDQVISRSAMMFRKTNTNGIGAAADQVMIGHLDGRMRAAPADRTMKWRGLAR